MENKRILFFSPSDDVAEITATLKSKYTNLVLDIMLPSQVPFDAQPSLLDEYIHVHNYDGVIAYGRLFQLLEHSYLIPVFELTLSDYDILAAATLAGNYQGKQILCIDSWREKQLFRLLSLLKIQIPIFPVENDTDINQALEQLIQSGYTIFAADAFISTFCKASGMHCLLMSPSYDTIDLLLQSVSQTFEHLDSALSLTNIFRSYIIQSNRSLLVYNGQKKLMECINANESPKLLSITDSLVEDVLEHKELSQMRSINSLFYYIKGTRLTIGEQVFVVFEVRQSIENKLIPIPGVTIKNQKNISNDFYNMFYDDLKNLDFRNKVIAYSSAQNPIVIIGEAGTGKSRLADFIYTYSPHRHSSLFLIDCKQLDKRGLHHLFSENSPLYEYGITLYFKEINLLKRKYIDELVEFLLQSSFMSRNKVIFSVTCSTDNFDENPLCSLLINKVSAFPLFLLPLRNRVSDIPNLAILYVNQLNEKYHKHIVGFEPEAMNYLQSFSWDENIKQFKRILEEVFVMTKEPFITSRKVVSVLKERKSAAIPIPAVSETGKTLDEIIQHGVRRALIANQMNQTMAAKELGISRTSLWRLLKKS